MRSGKRCVPSQSVERLDHRVFGLSDRSGSPGHVRAVSSFRYDELTEILHPRLQTLNLFSSFSFFLLDPLVGYDNPSRIRDQCRETDPERYDSPRFCDGS